MGSSNFLTSAFLSSEISKILIFFSFDILILTLSASSQAFPASLAKASPETELIACWSLSDNDSHFFFIYNKKHTSII